MHLLTEKVIWLNIFVTYFPWNRFLLISEWFPRIGRHIKVQEAVIWAKYFITKWNMFSQTKYRYNIMAFLLLPNREVINYSCISLKVFVRYLEKTLCKNKTLASRIKKILFWQGCGFWDLKFKISYLPSISL